MRLVEHPTDRCAPTPAELGSGELHLWCSVPDPGLPAARLDHVLQPEELARGRSMGTAHRRQEYLLTRALVREALSAYSPTAPSAWRFRTGPHGRPELDPPSPLRFNVSHCRGLVTCLVGLDRELGVDVEPVDRAEEVLELSGRIMSAAERHELGGLDTTEARHDLALSLWTLKEAYLKARGLGLTLPPGSLSFSTSPGAISLRAAADVEPAPEGWSFASAALGRHRLAVAAGPGPPRPSLLRLCHMNLLPSPDPRVDTWTRSTSCAS